jgi:hypothetical protein
MVEQKSKAKKGHRERLAELITLFSRCRQSHSITDGCGGGKSLCTPCPYEKEHSEMWSILGEDDFVFGQGMATIRSFLPKDVRRELYPEIRRVSAKEAE